ncbi:hypothetical protein Pcac1_g27842 [Phytophthora cactorum]|nr:hypothetical protein Pcac1_g27842 [Phytophthora cactorum]
MDTAHERRCTRCTRRRQALLDPGAYIDDQEQEATEDLDVKVTPTFSQQNGNTALHQCIERLVYHCQFVAIRTCIYAKKWYNWCRNRAAGVSTESNDDGDDRFEARTSGVLFTEQSCCECLITPVKWSVFAAVLYLQDSSLCSPALPRRLFRIARYFNLTSMSALITHFLA